MTTVMPLSPGDSDNYDPPPRKRGRPSDADGTRPDEEMDGGDENDEMFAKTDDEQENEEATPRTDAAAPRASAGSGTSAPSVRENHPVGHPADDRAAPREDGEPRALGPDAGRVPKTLTSPIRPSAEDVACHYCTHLPPRNWCPVCNQARLKEDPHARVSNEQEDRRTGLPVVSMDYQEADATIDGNKNIKSLEST